MKTYIIHLESAKEREPFIHALQSKTNAEIVPGIYNSMNGVIGCRDSHLKAYRLCPENEDLLLFEDDCIIVDDSILSRIEAYKSEYDIIYLGYTNSFQETPKGPILSYGTYSMWISAYAKQKLLAYSIIVKTKAIDHLWNQVQIKYNLRVLRPEVKDAYIKHDYTTPSYIKTYRDTL